MPADEGKELEARSRVASKQLENLDKVLQDEIERAPKQVQAADPIETKDPKIEVEQQIQQQVEIR